MKIGFFGGTFDPPHLSHSLACLYALETSTIEKILVVPCYRHPFGKMVADYEHRLAMCRLAMEGLGTRVVVSDLERERGGVSYTVETLGELQRRQPDDDLVLIMGTDVLRETEQWKDFDRVKEMCSIFVLPRVMPERGETVEKGRFYLPPVSSTFIREQLSKGSGVEQFVSGPVLDYIRQHHLYGS